MLKKIAGAGLCLLLTSSMCNANPFTDPILNIQVSTEDVASDEVASVTVKEVDEKTEEDNKEKEENSEKKEVSTEKAKTSEYTVVAGDYLMSIASKLLGDASRWTEIVELNKDKYPSLISNPNLIYVGWTLTIPAKDGSDSEASTAKDSVTAVTSKESGSLNNESKKDSDEKSTKKDDSSTNSETTNKVSSNSSDGPIINSNSRVLHIGDSHSCGVYGKTVDGLMRDTGAKVNTVAVAGSNPSYFMKGTTTKCGYYSKDENGKVTEPYWTTPMQTPLLTNLIDTYKPNVLVVSLGANMVGYGESTIRSMIESVCDKAKTAGCKIVWVGPPDSRIQKDSDVSKLYSILNSEIAKYDGVLVDSRKYTEYPSSGGDGLHYSGTNGTEKAKNWANSVMNAINGK